MKPLVVLAVVALVVGVPGCASGSAVGQAGETFIDRHDFDRRTRRFDLPGRLDEISGLAFSADGRLFAHDDERGRVYEVDPLSGDVTKRFDVGDDELRGDFEGIAIAGDRFFLISSIGLLYEFREAGDRENAAYRVTDTRVGANCEVEGLDYDPSDDALLIACKIATPDRGVIVVHRLPLDPARDRLPPVETPMAQLVAHGLRANFAPSAVAVDPAGTLLLLSGRDEALIEVDRSGRIIAGIQLSGRRHPQAEGLAFGPDGTLYISDEKSGNDARLTAYGRIGPGESP